MIVDLVLEARHAGRVGARLAIEPDRPDTGKDEPVPRKKYSALPGDNLHVILANAAPTLRQQENAAGCAVEEILRALRAYLTRQLGAEGRVVLGWSKQNGQEGREEEVCRIMYNKR